MKTSSIAAIVILAFAFIFTICFVGCHRVDAGNVGLKVNMAGGDKGVSKIEYATGWVFYMKAFTRVYEFPIYQQHKDYEPFEVSSKGGTVFTVHPGLNYNINSEHVSDMFQHFRVDVKALEDGYIKNAIFIAMREATNKFTVDSILNNVSSYDAAVTSELNKNLEPYFTVTQFTSKLKPDEKLSELISQKAQAIQNAIKIENEQKSIRAQAENDVIAAKRDSTVLVVNAAAKAREITLQQEALSKSPQYVELIKAQKWNGVLPQYMLGGNTSMFMSLPKQ